MEDKPADDDKLTIQEIVKGGNLDDPKWPHGCPPKYRDQWLRHGHQRPSTWRPGSDPQDNHFKGRFFGIAEEGSGEWESYCFQKKTAQALADKGTYQYMKDHEVIMHHLGKELTTRRVHWLPLRVTNDDLAQWVALYCHNLHSIVNEVSIAPKASGLLTGICRIGFVLNEGFTKMTITYDTETLANDGNTYRILISVNGRHPKCLKCSPIGHIRKLECGTWYHHPRRLSWAEIWEFLKSQRDLIDAVTISKIEYIWDNLPCCPLFCS